MELSIFQALGPIMIGPSSSHTAGATRLANVGRNIVGKPFKHVNFALHGSFAKTYKGHGTDMALVAGVLGIKQDDKKILDAFSLAKEAGITYNFEEIELEDVHENSLVMTFETEDGEKDEILGASIGGGEIRILRINGFNTEFDAQSNILIISNKDKEGILHWYSEILKEYGINIANMNLQRTQKGGVAFATIEVDEEIDKNVLKKILEHENVLSARFIRSIRED